MNVEAPDIRWQEELDAQSSWDVILPRSQDSPLKPDATPTPMAQQAKPSQPVSLLAALKSGIPWDWLEDAEKFRQYTCGQCKNLAKNAVELCCEVHFADKDFMPTPYCESYTTPSLLPVATPTKQNKKNRTHRMFCGLCRIPLKPMPHRRAQEPQIPTNYFHEENNRPSASKMSP